MKSKYYGKILGDYKIIDSTLVNTYKGKYKKDKSYSSHNAYKYTLLNTKTNKIIIISGTYLRFIIKSQEVFKNCISFKRKHCISFTDNKHIKDNKIMLNVNKYQFIEVKKKVDKSAYTRHYVRFSTDSKSEAIGRFKSDLSRGGVWASLLTKDHSYFIKTDDIENYRYVSQKYIQNKLDYFTNK